MGYFDWLTGGSTPAPTPPPRPRAQQQSVQQAQAQLQSSQAHAQTSLNQNATTHGAVLPCGAPATKPPCDIASFKVVEMRTLPNYANRQAAGGAATRNADEGDEDAKRKYPKDFEFDPKGALEGPRYLSGSVIEVIGQDKKVGGKTTVTVTFVELHKCAEHSKLRVVDPKGVATETAGVHSKQIEMEYPSLLPTLLQSYKDARANGVTADLWVWGYAPLTWELTAVVCGVRSAKDQIFGRTTARVHVWPADQFKMKLSVPPRYKRSGGNESQSWSRNGATVHTSESSRTTERNDGFRQQNGTSESTSSRSSYAERGAIRTSPRGETTRTETAHYGSDRISVTNTENTHRGQVTGLSEKVSTTTGSMMGTRTTSTQTTGVGAESVDSSENEYAGLIFWVKCSGHLVKDTFTSLKTVLAIVAGIKAAIKAIRGFFDAIRTVQYGVMAKMEFEFEFLSGEIEASWGWKEFSDHRCYFEYGITVSIMLFSASIDFSIGVGIKVGPVECSANIGVKGSIEFKLEGEAKREGPESYVKPELGIKLIGAPKLMLYVKAIAGSENFASAKASVTVAVKATSKPKMDKSAFAIVSSIKIEKTVAELSCVVGWVVKFNRSRDVFPEKSLVKDAVLRLA
jgi:hypothetical protein